MLGLQAMEPEIEKLKVLAAHLQGEISDLMVAVAEGKNQSTLTGLADKIDEIYNTLHAAEDQAADVLATLSRSGDVLHDAMTWLRHH